MKTAQNWLSKRTGERINLEKIEKKELIYELLHLKKEHEKLLKERENQCERKIQFIHNAFKTLSIYAIQTIDPRDRKEYEKFFEALFIE